MNDIQTQKKLLRKTYKNIRSNIPKEQKILFDKLIFERVTSLRQYEECKYLFTYVSLESETDTLQLIKKALSDGKTVAVPKCDDRHTMDFYIINSLDDLEQGAFGIPEPKNICTKAENRFPALCIVPALCFDLSGYRVGYGGGYYDRFLANFKGTSVGVCYSRCLCEECPKDIYDIAVDMIVTEKYFKIRSDKI